MLHSAALSGNTDTVKLLLKEGASVQAINIHSNSALHLAAQNGHTDIVELLLKEGASITAMGINDLTPLQLAAQNGRTGGTTSHERCFNSGHG